MPTRTGSCEERQLMTAGRRKTRGERGCGRSERTTRTGETSLDAAQLESQLARARLETLRAQLSPHFLFNALNAVAMLIRRGANSDALDAVVSLSELLRRMLDTRAAPEVRLQDEIALVERYLEIEKLRFRDRLRVRVELAPGVNDARVPSLILQPLVENAIKHGVAPTDGPRCLDIRARRGGDRLVVEVSDDGPGFAGGWDAKRAGGLGLANTRARLEGSYGRDYRFELCNADGGGACVRLEIPYTPVDGGTRRRERTSR